MQNSDLFFLFSRKFFALNIKHMITGSVAGMIYGEPRLTNDIDIVVTVVKFNANEFSRAFPENEFYCPPVEVLEIESRRDTRGHFNIIHHDSGFKADIYFVVESDFNNWAFEHINRVEFLGESILLAPPEYVILNKLKFYKEGRSEKHITDIKGILDNIELKIDWLILKKQVEILGLAKEYSLIAKDPK